MEELTPQLIGTCNRFRVDPLPVPQPQLFASSASAAAATAAAAAAPAAAVQPSAAAGAGTDTEVAAIGLAEPSSAGTASSDSSSTHHGPGGPKPGGAKPVPVSVVPAPPKTLMVFDGCRMPLGCTVLLWGASASELTKLKRVVKFGVLAAYHLSLENTFLAEELALATTSLASAGEAASICSYPGHNRQEGAIRRLKQRLDGPM